MSSAFHKCAVLALAVIASALACCTANQTAKSPPQSPPTDPNEGLAIPGVLRVAADPNNLPFSNDKGEGFENKIAELIGREFHFKLEYHWHAQRRGFFR